MEPDKNVLCTENISVVSCLVSGITNVLLPLVNNSNKSVRFKKGFRLGTFHVCCSLGDWGF